MHPVFNRLLMDLQSDWPFFLYMIMCQWFSVCFFRQRRAEEKQLLTLRADLFQRLDALEIAMTEKGESQAPR